MSMTKSSESAAGPADQPAGKPAERPVRSVRAAGKARSRRRLIEAAKRLIMERGYEGATVRDIAARAGLSTGAVFASFNDKAELFDEVLTADCEAQVAAMQAAAAGIGTVQERLLRVLSAGVAFHLAQPQLLRAALSVSWSRGLSGEFGDRPVRDAASDMIRQVLDAGVAAGELGPGLDRDLAADMLWDCYVGNYRRALFGSWDLDRLTGRMRAQIGVLLAAYAAA